MERLARAYHTKADGVDLGRGDFTLVQFFGCDQPAKCIDTFQTFGGIPESQAGVLIEKWNKAGKGRFRYHLEESDFIPAKR